MPDAPTPSHRNSSPGTSTGSSQPTWRQTFENGVNTAYGSPSPLRAFPGATAYGDPIPRSVRPAERNAAATAGAKDIGSKAIAYAEKNVQASLDYAQSLLKAKDLTDVMRLHSEYVQGQMRALAEQASEMGQAVTRAAMDAAKPKV